MKKYTTSFFLFGLLVFAPLGHADETYQNTPQETYGDKVGKKALSGFNNMGSALLEIPKNVINTTNDMNILYGLTGGVLKGTLHGISRFASGLTDVLTMAIPTEPVAKPDPIWKNFDAETTYGPVFRLDPETEDKVMEEIDNKYDYD